MLLMLMLLLRRPVVLRTWEMWSRGPTIWKALPLLCCLLGRSASRRAVATPRSLAIRVLVFGTRSILARMLCVNDRAGSSTFLILSLGLLGSVLVPVVTLANRVKLLAVRMLLRLWRLWLRLFLLCLPGIKSTVLVGTPLIPGVTRV